MCRVLWRSAVEHCCGGRTLHRNLHNNTDNLGIVYYAFLRIHLLLYYLFIESSLVRWPVTPEWHGPPHLGPSRNFRPFRASNFFWPRRRPRPGRFWFPGRGGPGRKIDGPGRAAGFGLSFHSGTRYWGNGSPNAGRENRGAGTKKRMQANRRR